MIYTTYFAQLRKLPKTITPISICGWTPDWYTGFEYRTLAPKYDSLWAWKQTHDTDYYIRQFHERVLNRLNADTMVSELQSIVGNDSDIALVCYEKPGDFCHRHLVASWLRENGYPCEEWVPS